MLIKRSERQRRHTSLGTVLTKHFPLAMPPFEETLRWMIEA